MADQRRRCESFDLCGGCGWQDVPYPEQLDRKHRSVRDSVKQAGEDPEVVQPVLEAPARWRYRNKMEFTFSPDGDLGFHQRGRYDQHVRVDGCLLASRQMEQVLREVQRWSDSWNLCGFHKRQHHGLLRHLMMRESSVTGRLMVVLYTHRGEEPSNWEVVLDDFVRRMRDSQANVASVMWGCNPRVGDVAAAPEEQVQLLFGSDHLQDKLAGYSYRIYRDTFFQVNHDQAESLVDTVVGLSGVEPDSTVMDLYSGIGALSLPLADAAYRGMVVGVEINRTSTESAEENASRNGIRNAKFVAGNARLVIPKLRGDCGSFDLVVLDPPRSGAGGKVMRKIGRTQSPVVVYVSCNPETFARDINELLPFRYRLERVVPLDMFPHTEHVELVALLKHKASG